MVIHTVLFVCGVTAVTVRARVSIRMSVRAGDRVKDRVRARVMDRTRVRARDRVRIRARDRDRVRIRARVRDTARDRLRGKERDRARFKYDWKKGRNETFLNLLSKQLFMSPAQYIYRCCCKIVLLVCYKSIVGQSRTNRFDRISKQSNLINV